MSKLLDLPKLLTARETSVLLRVAMGTLAQWRHHKRYDLPYLRIGHAVRYCESDVLAYIERSTRPQRRAR